MLFLYMCVCVYMYINTVFTSQHRRQQQEILKLQQQQALQQAQQPHAKLSGWGNMAKQPVATKSLLEIQREEAQQMKQRKEQQQQQQQHPIVAPQTRTQNRTVCDTNNNKRYCWLKQNKSFVEKQSCLWVVSGVSILRQNIINNIQNVDKWNFRLNPRRSSQNCDLIVFFVFKLVILQICCFMPLHEQQLWSEVYLRCFFRFGTDVYLKPEMNWLKIDGRFKQQLKNSEASRVKL